MKKLCLTKNSQKLLRRRSKPLSSKLANQRPNASTEAKKTPSLKMYHL